MAETTTPTAAAKPGMATVNAPLVLEGVGAPLVPVVGLLVLVVAPVPVAVEVLLVEAPEAEGSPVKSALLSKGVQELDAGTRAVYGMVEIAPRDSGGWV